MKQKEAQILIVLVGYFIIINDERIKEGLIQQ